MNSPQSAAPLSYDDGPAPTAQSPSGRRRALLSFALRALFGLGLLSFVLSRIDFRHLWTILSGEKPAYFIAAVMLYIGGQTVAAYRWSLLARVVGIVAPAGEFVLYFFVGVFTNLFVPGLIGGDAARSVYLGHRHGAMGHAVASVAADRLIGLLVLIWLAGACALILGVGILPRAVVTPLALLAGGSLLGYLFLPLIARLLAMSPARLERITLLLAPYVQSRLVLIPPILLSLVLHVSQVICQWLLARGLGLSLTFKDFFLVVPTTNALASLPLTFNGLGVREGVYVLLFGLIGLEKTSATALGLLWFAISTLSGILSSIAFFLAPIARTASSEPQQSSAN